MLFDVVVLLRVLSRQGMWQVFLSQLVSWANVCPRSASLAEVILLCGAS